MRGRPGWRGIRSSERLPVRDDDRQYIVATFTAKNLTKTRVSMFDVSGGDDPLCEVVDTYGERVKPSGFLKVKPTEQAQHEFEPGDGDTFRVIFRHPNPQGFSNRPSLPADTADGPSNR